MLFYLHSYGKQTEKGKEWDILVLETEKVNVAEKKKKQKRGKRGQNQHPNRGKKMLKFFPIVHWTGN